MANYLDLKELGQAIKNLREINRLTQKELAQKLGKSESLIQKYEYGKTEPPLSVLIEMTNIFKISFFMLTALAIKKAGD